MADQFVKMTKDGETIEVSPLVVKDHERLGWKVVEAMVKTETEAADADVDADAKAKAKSKK
jgi:hypothetical protein